MLTQSINQEQHIEIKQIHSSFFKLKIFSKTMNVKHFQALFCLAIKTINERFKQSNFKESLYFVLI